MKDEGFSLHDSNGEGSFAQTLGWSEAQEEEEEEVKRWQQQ